MNGIAGALVATWRKKRCATVTYATPRRASSGGVGRDLLVASAEVEAALDAVGDRGRAVAQAPLQLGAVVRQPRARVERPATCASTASRSSNRAGKYATPGGAAYGLPRSISSNGREQHRHHHADVRPFIPATVIRGPECSSRSLPMRLAR